MRIEFPFIRRGNIEGEILRARLDERDKTEKQTRKECFEEISELKEKHKRELAEKDASNKSLEKVIDDNHKMMQNARKKEMAAQEIFMKAKELVSRCDYI